MYIYVHIIFLAHLCVEAPEDIFFSARAFALGGGTRGNKLGQLQCAHAMGEAEEQEPTAANILWLSGCQLTDLSQTPVCFY
jgi:hypothetical protein